jgi:hypothetical protein
VTQEPPQQTQLEAATSQRCDGSADTQLRQCVKAKSIFMHGDDAEPRPKSRLSTRLEAATSKRCGESEDTQLRQRDKAKSTIPHGDDAEVQEPPQHTVGGGDSAVMRESVKTLSSYNATKPRRQSPTVTTPRHKSRLSMHSWRRRQNRVARGS